MNRPLSLSFNAVAVKRDANQDVFVWPSVEWDLLYCHEELTELARVVQNQRARSRPQLGRCQPGAGRSAAPGMGPGIHDAGDHRH